ncbi:MAG: imidazole glycerol phosphate synthase subunit HisH [Elusimicrobia bacterium]|nr:imidazole glycerol phosphate synthase subunit HisH [Elusimicrobiota bacterium]
MPVKIPYAAIVDYGMGNLFSVKLACEQMGLKAQITSSAAEILGSSAVILPGVGAFGDAMDSLRRLDLVSVIRDVAQSHKPLVGICLGLQLLFSESHEFGRHRGLGIIEGEVVRLESGLEGARKLKVPQIGWNRVDLPQSQSGPGTPMRLWQSTLLSGILPGEYFYFVHSFYAKPADSQMALSVTRYGAVEFCSSISKGNIFACQFHPERSARPGLQVYRNLANIVSPGQQEPMEVSHVTAALNS